MDFPFHANFLNSNYCLQTSEYNVCVHACAHVYPAVFLVLTLAFVMIYTMFL